MTSAQTPKYPASPPISFANNRLKELSLAARYGLKHRRLCTDQYKSPKEREGKIVVIGRTWWNKNSASILRWSNNTSYATLSSGIPWIYATRHLYFPYTHEPLYHAKSSDCSSSEHVRKALGWISSTSCEMDEIENGWCVSDVFRTLRKVLKMDLKH